MKKDETYPDAELSRRSGLVPLADLACMEHGSHLQASITVETAVMPTITLGFWLRELCPCVWIPARRATDSSATSSSYIECTIRSQRRQKYSKRNAHDAKRRDPRLAERPSCKAYPLRASQ